MTLETLSLNQKHDNFKLIKINNELFLIDLKAKVSEIDLNTMVVELLTTGGYDLFMIDTLNDLDEKNQYKILFTTVDNKRFIPLIEENNEEAEKLAERHCREQNSKGFEANYTSFIKGYNKLKEEMFTKEQMEKAFRAFSTISQQPCGVDEFDSMFKSFIDNLKRPKVELSISHNQIINCKLI